MTAHPDDDPGTTTLNRLRAVDNESWVKFVDTYFDSIYRWCQEGGLDSHSAADVTQEVLISALGSLGRFEREGPGSFSGWLRRICQRRIADFYRRKQEDAIGGTDAIKAMQQLECVRIMLAEEDLKELNWINDDRLFEAITLAQKEFEETTWQAFWLSIMEGKSTTDTALELGITKNAVYLSRSRICKRLRELLSKDST